LAIEAGGSWNVLGYRNVSADIFNAPYYYAGFVMVGLFCLILTIPGWIGCYAGKRRPGTWDFLIAIFGSVITVCWGLLVAPEHPATFQTGVNILTFMIVYGIILTIAKLAIPKTPREFKPKPQEMKEVKYDPQKT
nr:hypothetical protein [Candidatus Sigynarchaeota archaeon]